MSYIDLDALEAWAKEADTYCTILPTNVLALIARVRTAEAAIQAVLELHAPMDNQNCGKCIGLRWPCQTARAAGVVVDGADR